MIHSKLSGGGEANPFRLWTRLSRRYVAASTCCLPKQSNAACWYIIHNRPDQVYASAHSAGNQELYNSSVIESRLGHAGSSLWMILAWRWCHEDELNLTTSRNFERHQTFSDRTNKLAHSVCKNVRQIGKSKPLTIKQSWQYI